MDISLTQGDEKAIKLTFTAAGAPQNITGSTVTMTVKRDKSDTTPKILKTVTEHTDAAGGVTLISLSEEDTSIDFGEYFYDIRAEGGALPTKTISKGMFIVGWRVYKEPAGV